MTEELPEPGHRIGRYRVEKLLGEGGMGAVFAATNDVTGRAVAIKWMLPAMARSAEAVKRFLAEARATARIEHPNVIQIIDVGQDGAAPFLVMERLRGESLGERLGKEGRLSIQETLSIMIPACRGVAEAHSEGIIHRDIKPDNIFLCHGKDGSPRPPKVLDFGISKLYEEGEQKLTQTGAIMGTPLYMSPEQINARREPDAGFDIYSLGVVLYECLAGRVPFDAPGLIGLLQRIGSGSATPLHAAAPDVPSEVCDVVMRAMAANRDHRYSTMQELITELERLQSTKVDNSPAGPVDRGTAPVGTGPLPSPTQDASRPVPHAAQVAATGPMPPTQAPQGAIPATQVAPGYVPTQASANAVPATVAGASGFSQQPQKPDNAGKVLLMMAVGLVTVLILSGFGLAYIVLNSDMPDRPISGPVPTSPSTPTSPLTPQSPVLPQTPTPPTQAAAGGPEVGLTFSGGCSAASFAGTITVVGARNSITVVSLSGMQMNGNLTLGLPVSMSGGGTLPLSTQGRIDEPEGLVHIMVGQTLWMNMAADTAAVMQGGPDPISGQILVRSFNGSGARCDVTFQNAVLQNMEDASLCTINGTLRTNGAVFGGM